MRNSCETLEMQSCLSAEVRRGEFDQNPDLTCSKAKCSFFSYTTQDIISMFTKACFYLSDISQLIQLFIQVLTNGRSSICN